MLYATIAYYLALAVALGLSAVYYAHMFQLESYLPVQFLKWLFDRSRRKRIGIFLPALAAAFIMLFWRGKLWPVAVSAACLALCAWFFRPYKAKKPLVVTARVRRMFVTYAILIVLCTVFDLVGLTALLMPLSGLLLLLAN